jgi:hypothetical protein
MDEEDEKSDYPFVFLGKTTSVILFFEQHYATYQPLGLSEETDQLLAGRTCSAGSPCSHSG